MSELTSCPVRPSTPGHGRLLDDGARLVAEITFAVEADADCSHEYECLILDFGK